MRVKLAVQVLSRSVAVGIRCMVRHGRMPKEALETADVVEQTDRLFNLMNSSTTDHRGSKKPLQRHLLHVQLQEMHEMREFVASWSLVTWDNKEKAVVYLTRDIRITLRSMEMLAADLLGREGFQYLCTRRLNQDFIENIFSQVRAYNGHNSHPTVGQLHVAYRALSCRHLLERQSRTMQPTAVAPTESGARTSCETDKDFSLLSVFPRVPRWRERSSCADGSATITFPIPLLAAPFHVRPSRAAKTLAVGTIFEVASRISATEADVLSYIDGWVIKKLVCKFACPACDQLLLSDQPTPFIRERLYPYAQQDALTTPSHQLLSVVLAWENIIRPQLLEIVHLPGIVGNLSQLIRGSCRAAQLVCSAGHDRTPQLLRKFLTFRLHNFCRFVNRTLADDRRKVDFKLRKLNARTHRQNPRSSYDQPLGKFGTGQPAQATTAAWGQTELPDDSKTDPATD